MDKLPVGQLPDLQQSNNDDEIMVITNSEYSQLKKEKISDLITDFTSTNENNALTKGTDGKLFVTDFGNASNITEGTLPVSVLPDIPKDLLPAIETADLPLSGVTADTYAYPSSVTVNAQGQVTAIEEGTPSGSNADTDLSNITEAGKEVIRENAGSGLEIGDIGIAALGIDESKGLRRYLNGSILTANANTQGFINKLKSAAALYPSLICTETQWQGIASTSVGGQCGKFVINYETDETTVISVRLPKIIMPIQGLTDLSKLGEIVEAGLPNITGSFRVRDGNNLRTGDVGEAIKIEKTNTNAEYYNSAIAGTYYYYQATLDVSNSSPIYKDGVNSVQQEQIQYPYFIQVATGAETENNIINEIELNNPFSLFDSKYSDHELNNLSWLKSEGQWNAKAVYPTAYDKLLKVYNGTETVEGLSVKLSTEEYTDYDFVLNTADETFRLPLLDGSEDIIGNEYETISTAITTTKQAFVAKKNGIVYASASSPQANVLMLDVNNVRSVLNGSWFNGICRSGGSVVVKRGDTIAYSTEKNSSTDPATTYVRIFYAQGNGNLYFYVGETVQNANLINAGRIEEQLATKTDMQQAANASMPSNKYIDLTLGASGTEYTAPADGWVCLMKQSTGANQYVTVDQNIDGKHFRMMSIATANGQNIAAYLPVAKGAVFMANYSAAGVLNTFRFYYAQGARND